MSTSDIELAVTTARRLESLLESRFGASGRGLHEKLASVEATLPPDVLRDGRYVATMRNKVVHEDSFSLPDRDRFLRCAQAFEKALGGKVTSGLLGTAPGGKVKKGFKVRWDVPIFVAGVVIWLNALPVLKWGGQEGFLLLVAATLMTVIPPIRWLAPWVRKHKRGLVAFLLLFGLLWIIVASIIVGGRPH
jgi:hypothetical protein